MNNKRQKILKIVLTGAESSGKTTLSQYLAQHFQVPLVVEAARGYLENQVPPQYSFDDLSQIARQQLFLEAQATHQAHAQDAPAIICDTDLLTIKIWSEEVFGRVEKWIEQHLQCIPSDDVFYLLCSPKGIAWQPDPLRENPHDRERLFDLYEKTLQKAQFRYQILRGGIATRQNEAKAAIERLITFKNLSK